MSNNFETVINDEAFEGAVMMNGDFTEFMWWNTILALDGLKPIR